MPTLRQYQKEDLEFLLKTNSAGIFSEQRTGKTPLAISVAKERKVTKTLILCPPSAIPVWVSQWQVWHPGQPIIGVTGRNYAEKKEKINQWTHALVISYDTLKATKVRKGFIDDLEAHALVISCNDETVLMISVDTCMIDNEIYNKYSINIECEWVFINF